MADIKISVSVSVIICIIVGELVSSLWYHYRAPWYGSRYLLTAVIADAGLVVILKYITQKYYRVTYRAYEAAAWLAGGITLLFACLEAPHVVHNTHSLWDFTFHALHKFLLVFIVSLVMDYCDKHF